MAWKGLACAAALAVAGWGSAAWADLAASNANNVIIADAPAGPYLLDDATTAPSTAPAAPASAPSQTTLTPLMFALDPTPVGKWLESNKFNITGFGELGYFLDTNDYHANTDSPTLIGFPGAYSNHLMLDQLDLTLQKSVDTTKSWDWGFLVEAGYGIDDAYIHSHGLLDNAPVGTPGIAFGPGAGPQNQFDLVQANVSLLAPLGSGLTITAGKFIALLGDETINPTGNLFFSHSYNFTYGIMYTNTGVLGSYTFSKLVNGNDLTVQAGITNGWNQSLRDNNSAIDFLGEAKTSLTSKLALTFNIEEGPEGTNDNSDYWTALEAIPVLTISDQLTLTGDFLYVDAPHTAATTPGAAAQWYGAVLYPSYKINSMFSVNLRGEWYRDQGGFTTGVQANYYELTLGTQIHPLPNDNILQYLQFRPEVRVDDADRRAYNSGNGARAGDYSELTFAVDAIMQF